MSYLGPKRIAVLVLIETLAAHAKVCTCCAEGLACTRTPFLVARIIAYTQAHFTEGRSKRIRRHALERLYEEHPENVPANCLREIRRKIDTLRDRDN